MAHTVKDTDPLEHLEERIQKAVALVSRLRDEKEAALKAVAQEKETAAKAAATAAEEKEAAAKALADEKEAATQAAAAAAKVLAEEKEAAATALAEEKEAAAQQKEAGDKVTDALRVDLEEAHNTNKQLTAEIEGMREERQQVRSRLEKLLGHIDKLGAA